MLTSWGSKEKVRHFFLELHQDVQETFRQADYLPLPLTLNDLKAKALNATLASHLVQRLLILISRKTNMDVNSTYKLWRTTFFNCSGMMVITVFFLYHYFLILVYQCKYCRTTTMIKLLI